MVDLKRYEVRNQSGYYWHYLNSLPDEIPFHYILDYEVAKDQKTEQVVLNRLFITSPDNNNINILIYDRNLNNVKADINKLFITKSDIEKFRAILQSKYSEIKEFKGIDPSKIQLVGEYYSVRPNQDRNRNESYAVFGYMHVVRYDKEYYGGSDKYYRKIITTFDTRNRYKPNKIISDEFKIDPRIKNETAIKNSFETLESIDLPEREHVSFQFYSVDNDWRFAKPKEK